jgi:uncharacterized protein (TIGR00730 family)
MDEIGVFCSANIKVGDEYKQAARELGMLIGKDGNRLIYGGTMNGLMGILAKFTVENGGRIRGFLPYALRKDRLNGEILVKDLNERLSLITQNSDGFIALAGGIGTLHEIMDVIASMQLRIICDKPLALVNTWGYYNNFVDLLERFEKDGFIQGNSSGLYFVAETPAEAYNYVKSRIKTHETETNPAFLSKLSDLNLRDPQQS